jgi:hypothetical protein
MTILIDARLEQAEPVIYLRNLDGRVMMYWKGHTVRQWLENGDISPQDLLRSDYNWQDLLAATRG